MQDFHVKKTDYFSNFDNVSLSRYLQISMRNKEAISRDETPCLSWLSINKMMEGPDLNISSHSDLELGIIVFSSLGLSV